MSKLAVHGGNPVRKKPFPSQNTMDYHEYEAVIDIMRKGRLSGYRASWNKEFWGGPAIQALEEQWQKKFNVKHAIPVNSCTSGLQIACGAIGLEPGESQIIVSPYSMTCSATAPLLWGATPVFADILEKYQSLDPKSVEEQIGPRTKAIIVVDLFGQIYNSEINKIAKKYNLIVIEDAAQAIGSHLYGKDTPNRNETIAAGTLGDIGVYSFNYGKHISAGEGGMIVTNNDELAMKMRLLMNHSEAVINSAQLETLRSDHILNKINFNHMFGFNMRMTELSACIISEQLKKFDDLLCQRLNNVQILNYYLNEIPPITPYPTMPKNTNSYYVCSFEFDNKKSDGISRNTFINAVKAELPPRIGRENEDCGIGNGYIKPIYLMNLFQDRKQQKKFQKSAFATFPITNYEKGSCPVAEDLYENKLFLTILHAPNSTTEDMKDICNAFEKVWENRDELK